MKSLGRLIIETLTNRAHLWK